MRKLLLMLSFLILSALSMSAANISTVGCVGCHGAKWEKHALGKSKVVADLNETEIATALKGYKAGTFGGAMKGVMKGQVSKYSDEELDLFAKKIASSTKK